MNRLNGKIAIVTGAAQGIGAVYARALSDEGAAVAVCDIAEPKDVVDLIISAGGRAIGSRVDVTDANDVGRFVERTAGELGGIDILVNNAALFANLVHRAFSDIPSEEWDRVMSVNARGVFEVSRAVLPHMRARGKGKIINITSSTIYVGSPMLLHYVASKGAVQAMTRAMARELGPDNITVNAIAPGFTLSEGVTARESFRSMADRVLQTRSIKRDQRPEDLVGPLLYFASGDSDFVSGQSHVVDGGSTMI